MTNSTWNKFQWAAWIAALGLTSLSAAWAPRAFTLGLAAGMGLMMINFYILRKVAAWFVSGQTKGQALSAAVWIAKFGVLFGATYWVLKIPQVDSLGFGLGIVAVPLAMGFSVILGGSRFSEA